MVPLRKAVLEDIRNSRGLTRPELADQVGCSRPHYNNVEAGRKCAKKALANRIAIALCVPVDRIIDFEKLQKLQDEAAA